MRRDATEVASMWVDSHSPFDLPEFDRDRSEVLARARTAGVSDLIVPAIAADRWDQLRSICANDAGLHPAYGLHPMFLDRHEPEHLGRLAQWIEQEQPCAVGECGLDFFVEGLDPDAQRDYFKAQLRLAREYELPLILHARRAVDEVIQSVRSVGGLRGVIHSWSGSEEQARQLFQLGFHLGIGGPVTYERARRLRRIVASMPIEFLLLETDAPDQPSSDRRGERNEPACLAGVAQTVADLRGVEIEALAEATSRNARILFGLS
jgi:TatD DNase family protein